jgi:hypothetical protein
VRSPQQEAARRRGATRDDSALGMSHAMYNGTSFGQETGLGGR